MSGRDDKKRIRLTAAASAAAVAGMVALTAASVPLYSLFCKVTGYGGSTRTAEAAPAAPTERPITVRFDSSVGKGLNWSFKPAQLQVKTALGQEVLAVYTAVNNSDHPITGTAVFNVTPAKIGRYFNKIECFCFTEQTLAPGQSVDMPVVFFVDPALAQDHTTEEVGVITLSYTFYDITDRQGRS